MPTGWAFILFVVLVTVLSLLGLYLIKLLGIPNISCDDNNTVVNIFLGVVAVFLSVLLSFLIVTVWDRYSQAELNANSEAQALFLLYETITILNLPGTDVIQQQIITYLEYIINVEYPDLKNGVVPTEGTTLFIRLQQSIYNLDPQTNQHAVLYNEAIDWLNQAIQLRIDRINSATRGVYDVIWWVNVIDAVLIIILVWFVTCAGIYHYILTAFAAIYVGSALFLAIILTYPFMGYAALPSTPFEIALFYIENPV
jgi:hypothetical protein